MSSLPLAPDRMPRIPAAPALRRFRFSRADVAPLLRRLAHSWIVWSALLSLHEGGHALTAWRQGLAVRRVTVGMGPIVWQGHRGATQLVLRAVPVAGVTSIESAPVPVDGSLRASAWLSWKRQFVTLAGGVGATLALAVLVAGLVALAERVRGSRWIWGRMLVADAIVLTVFNFLPVPPLDGGRAVLGAVAAWRGAPLVGSSLFWVQTGGLALAVLPMTLWTRWTSRIDAVAMWWGAPRRSWPTS